MGRLDEKPTLVRVHSENVLGDVFRSTDITGRDSIARAMRRIAEAGRGALVYIEQPNSGLALEGSDQEKAGRVRAASMNLRDYGVGAQILASLGLKEIRLMSSSNRKLVGLDGYGLKISELVPLGA
jgi:3,4-dihydroxy 2-butanone 4-phosphate synthase/GTP cyclohydrolase II